MLFVIILIYSLSVELNITQQILLTEKRIVWGSEVFDAGIITPHHKAAENGSWV